MAAHPHLPASLQKQLSALARHIRFVRFFRGISFVVAATLVTFLGVGILDALVYQQAEVLRYFLVGILGVIGVVGIFGCVLPLLRPLNWKGLAAIIEERYPELHERLLSSVDLDANGNPHGSKFLIARVLAETDVKAKSLVFERAIPKTSAYAVGIFAACCLLACGVLFALAPSHSLDFTQRLLTSWNAQPPIEFDVTPGDRHAAYRRSVGFEVTIRRRNEHVAWPSECQLVLTAKSGETIRKTMEPKPDQTYTFRLESLDDTLTYHVEAGGHRSRTFSLVPVEPVELISEKVSILVTPPEYLSKRKARQYPGGIRVAALEYSRITCRLPFTREAQSATLRIDRVNADGEATKLWSKQTKLMEDRKIGLAALPALSPGNYKVSVRMEAEHEVTTTQPVFRLLVKADSPPEWETEPPTLGRTLVRTKPGERPKVPSTLVQTVRPKGKIHLRGLVHDDEGLDSIVVEYYANQGEKKSHTIVKAKGARKAILDNHFSLPKDMKQGDDLFYRIVVADNRIVRKGSRVGPKNEPVPSRDLGPHVIVHPPDGWFVVKVQRDAIDLAKREINNQKEMIGDKLEAIKKAIRDERKQIDQLDDETRPLEDLSPEHQKRLASLVRQNQDVTKDVDALKQAVDDIPELLGLARLLESLYSNELNDATNFLEVSLAKKAVKSEREKNLGLASLELLKALKKLGEIEKLNREIAAKREKMRELNELAQKEDDLSAKTAKLEDSKNKNKPDWKAELEKLKKEQEQVEQALAKMAQNDPELNKGLQMEKANQLANKADALAKKQKELIEKKDKALQERIKLVLNDFAKKQQALVDDAKDANQKSKELFAKKQIYPAATKPGEDAANALRHHKARMALVQQDQQMKELLRAAARLRGQKLPTDNPGKLIRKLAELQEDLNKRLKEESGKIILRPQREILAWRKEIVEAQRKIAETTKRLLLPDEGQIAQATLDRTRERLAEATKYTQRLNPLRTLQAMEQAQKALEQLARLVPPAPKTVIPKKTEGPTDTEVAQEAEKLRQLALRQDKLKRELQKFLQNPTGEMATDKKVDEEQKSLANETEKLAQDLAKLAQDTNKMKEANKPAQKATTSAKQAQQAMTLSQQQAKGKRADQARQSDQRAKEKLKQAASAAKQTAMRLAQAKGKFGKGDNAKSMPQTKANKSFQEGRRQVSNAKSKLSQGQLKGAKPAMQKAAQALRNAAKQMSQQLQKMNASKAPTPKTDTKRSMGSMPSALQPPAAFKDEFEKHQGKRWGELPGELKSRMMMEMRARYGEAYATIIQRYFEEIANTQKDRK